MGTTADFTKLRSNSNPKLGEWNKDYAAALNLAKKNGKFIIAVWSNGDACSLCVKAEKCMMESTFKNWMKTSDAYFVFQYSGDADKGKTVHDLIFNNKTKVSRYPGFRVTLYDTAGKIVCDYATDGNTLRGSKTGASGATAMVNNLKAAMAKKPANTQPTSSQTTEDYAVRLNEKLTVKKINAILDALDKNDGYCPCQAGKSTATKCHCKDFKENKKIGQPCICNIYVKQKPVAKKK